MQLLFEGEGHTLINDVGGLCEENASIELVQLIVGEHIAVDGARVDLVGDGSKFESAMGYLAAERPEGGYQPDCQSYRQEDELCH